MRDILTGRCPGCDEFGVVAEACSHPACMRHGLHLVPEHELPTDGTRPDPMVGRMVAEFLILARIGAGGAGAVYRVEQQPIGLPAALKILTGPGIGLGSTDRFRLEARALARLTHPNIVRMLKFGEHNSSPFLVMELVEGGRTLADKGWFCHAGYV